MRIAASTLFLLALALPSAGAAAGAADPSKLYAELKTRADETGSKDTQGQEQLVQDMVAFLAKHPSFSERNEVRFLLSESLQMIGRVPEAVRHCDEALAQEPPQDLKERLLVSRAEAFGWAKQEEKKAAELEKAMPQLRDPERRVKVVFQIAEWASKSGRHDRSRALFDALAAEPLPPALAEQVLLGRARAYRLSGQADKIIAELTAAAPGAEDARTARARKSVLAGLYKKTGRLDEARALYGELAREGFGRTARRARRELEELDILGKEPPAFSVRDTRGGEFSLAHYRGKVVLLDFWASWCGPCVAELPNVKDAYDAFRSKGFEILAVSLDDSREKMDGFLAKHKLDWPQFFDGKGWNNELAELFGVEGIPYTMILDRSGKIRAVNVRGDELKPAIQQLL